MFVCVCGCAGVFAAISVMTATPERIELENYRHSSTQVELEEVSEETLNQFNLSPDRKQSHRSRSGRIHVSEGEVLHVAPEADTVLIHAHHWYQHHLMFQVQSKIMRSRGHLQYKLCIDAVSVDAVHRRVALLLLQFRV